MGTELSYPPTMPRKPKKPHWDAQRLEDMLSGKERVPPPKVEAPPVQPSTGVVMSPRTTSKPDASSLGRIHVWAEEVNGEVVALVSSTYACDVCDRNLTEAETRENRPCGHDGALVVMSHAGAKQ